jgi:hypothetical protein
MVTAHVAIAAKSGTAARKPLCRQPMDVVIAALFAQAIAALEVDEQSCRYRGKQAELRLRHLHSAWRWHPKCTRRFT